MHLQALVGATGSCVLTGGQKLGQGLGLGLGQRQRQGQGRGWSELDTSDDRAGHGLEVEQEDGTCCSSRRLLVVSSFSFLGVMTTQLARPRSGLATGSYELQHFYKPDGKERSTDPYEFDIPAGWLQEPVSLNDAKLYGTDTRFSGPNGSLEVLVLPVGNGDIETIEQLGDTDGVIGRFGPPDQPAKVVDSKVGGKNGKTYYLYELNTPHRLLSAYVSGSQLYVFIASASGKQWRFSEAMLREMRDSFASAKAR